MAENLAGQLHLMLVTDDLLLDGRDPVEVCLAAQRGGATCVQLRLKFVRPRDLLRQAHRLRAALSIPIIVNDRADVAIAAASGVHLGPGDIPADLVRLIAPKEMIVGCSVGSTSEVEGGRRADYWGIGPWRLTRTKPDAGAALGAEGFRALAQASGGRPCVAIGGVTPEDVGPARRAGAAGVAVISGILGRTDIEEATREYAKAWEEASR
ncbi:MAG: thiamine phosphate synthase [Gemmatimonadota bacterium]